MNSYHPVSDARSGSHRFSGQGNNFLPVKLAVILCLVFFTIGLAIAGQKEIWEHKLESIIFPSVEINGAKIEAVIDYLRIKSRSLDTNEQNPSLKGINLVLKSDSAISSKTIQLNLSNASLLEVVRNVTRLAGLSYEVNEEGVVIGPIVAPTVAAVVAPNPIVSDLHVTLNKNRQAPHKSYEENYKFLAIIKGDVNLGSGFIAKYLGNPVLFTNTHVLSGNAKIEATLLSGQNIAIKEGLTVADQYDLSFFQQKTLKEGMDILNDIEKNVSVGDDVVVLGNSLGAGVVTELRGKVTGIGPELIEVDAKFVSGNSGSPVIHVKTGKVIGIATFSTLRTMEGFGKDSKFNSVERRFAYRLDNILGLVNITWQVFQAEAKTVKDFTTRTDQVWNLAVDIATNQKIVNWEQHLSAGNCVKMAVNKWQIALAQNLSSNKSTSRTSSRSYNKPIEASGGITAAKDSLLFGVISTLRSDLMFLKPETYTAYHRKEIESQMKYRDFLTRFFYQLKSQISNDPQSITR